MNVFAWFVVKREQGRKSQNFENPLIISLSGTVRYKKLSDENYFKINLKMNSKGGDFAKCVTLKAVTIFDVTYFAK